MSASCATWDLYARGKFLAKSANATRRNPCTCRSQTPCKDSLRRVQPSEVREADLERGTKSLWKWGQKVVEPQQLFGKKVVGPQQLFPQKVVGPQQLFSFKVLGLNSFLGKIHPKSCWASTTCFAKRCWASTTFWGNCIQKVVGPQQLSSPKGVGPQQLFGKNTSKTLLDL